MAERRSGKRPTVKDVAIAAGVAVSTASAVLRADRSCYVSDETRARVHEASRKLGYRANQFARALRGGRSYIVAVLFDSLAAPSSALARLAGIEERAWETGYRVIYGNHYGRIARQREHIKEFLANQVDGLILVAPHPDNADLVQQAMNQNVPLVTIDSLFDFATLDVTVDRCEGARLQVEHAYSIGRSRIAFLMPQGPTGLAPKKMRGYQQGLAEQGSSLDDHVIAEMPGVIHDRFIIGSQLTETLLKRGEKFDAVIVPGDSVAVGVMQALHRAGLRVPEDVAVIGFDDEDFASALPIPLTTIRQPRDIGERALAILLEAIEARQDPKASAPDLRQQLITPELIVRESTRGPDSSCRTRRNVTAAEAIQPAAYDHATAPTSSVIGNPSSAGSV